MKTVVKFISVCVFIIMIFTTLITTAFAVKIDGVYGNIEWKEALEYKLDEQKEFKNEVNSAIVKVIYDDKLQTACFAFFIEFGKGEDISESGVLLGLNGDSIGLLCPDGTAENYNKCDFDFAANYYADSHTAVIETKVYLNGSLSPGQIFTVDIYDFNGKISRTYNLDLFIYEDAGSEVDIGDSFGYSDGKTKSSKTKKSKSGSSSNKSSKIKKNFNFKKAEKTRADSADLTDFSDEAFSEKKAEKDTPVQKAFEYDNEKLNPKTVKIVVAVFAVACAAAVAGTVAIKNMARSSDEDGEKNNSTENKKQ